MRLIDADKLLQDFEEKFKATMMDSKYSAMLTFDDAIDSVNEQSTAFDVENVVEQLEEKSYYIDIETDREVVNLNEAIEIIRGGGV